MFVQINVYYNNKKKTNYINNNFYDLSKNATKKKFHFIVLDENKINPHVKLPHAIKSII